MEVFWLLLKFECINVQNVDRLWETLGSENTFWLKSERFYRKIYTFLVKKKKCIWGWFFSHSSLAIYYLLLVAENWDLVLSTGPMTDWWDCEVSIHRDVPNPTGHSPQSPDPCWPLGNLQKSFAIQIILWFCNYTFSLIPKFQIN